MELDVKLVTIVILGALALSPMIAGLGFDPIPGDVACSLGAWHIVLPLTYSLCASMGLTLLYLVMKG